MRKTKLQILLIVCLKLCLGCRESTSNQSISFYSVPLVCGAAPEIGCGSRIKPLFVDLENEKGISEAWTNREGTILAIKWVSNSTSDSQKKLTELFEKHKIEAQDISDQNKIDSLNDQLASNPSRWLKGMAVDSLSLYEAGVIAATLTDFAKEAKLITQEEQDRIKPDIETYFKVELVKVRTEEELKSQKCQDEWKMNGLAIYEKHIGKERAAKVSRYFNDNEIEIMKQESCCSEDEDKCFEKKEDKMVETSTITCPYCGHKKLEKLPTDVCQIRYTCENCKKDIFPKTGDCCVFCTYGDHKCPSKQES